jgi:hypothetical protein
MGELYNPLGFCEACPIGYTTFIQNENYLGPCQKCTVEMICQGGAKVAPSPGYFRYEKTSDNFLKCPVESSCLKGVISGQNLSKTGYCGENYQGNLCFSCKNERQKLRALGNCIQCSVNPLSYLAVLGTIMLSLGLMHWLMILTVRKSKLLQLLQAFIMNF